MSDSENEIRKQITSAMQLKETDELIAIYSKQNEDEWSVEALEVVEQILVERLGSLPADLSAPSDRSKPSGRLELGDDLDQLTMKQLMGRLIEVQERQTLIWEEVSEHTSRWYIIGVLSLGIFLGLISTVIFIIFISSLIN